MEHEEWVWTGVYTLLSMITRYWRIGAANYVVWDEVSEAMSRICYSFFAARCRSVSSSWQSSSRV